MGGGGEKAWGGRTGGFGGRSSGGSFDGGLINPAGIPGPDLDGDLIRDVARGLETFRDSVRAALGQAKTAWTGLSSALTGDGLEVLHTGLDSPAANADDVADRFGQVAAMLRIFAATVDDVKPKFDSARADAQALIDELGPYRKTWEPVADTTLVNRYGPCYWTDPDKNIAYWNSKGYSARVGRRYIEVYVYWLESETMVKRSNDLVERVDAVYATLQQGEADCANGLNGLLAGVCVAPVQAYTAEEIQAYTHDYQMPWGGWEYGTLNWAESTNKAIVDDFLLGTWAGVQSLVGVDPTTGQWSLGTAGQAWLGVGEAVGSLVVATSPLAAVGAALPGKAGDVFRSAQQNVVELGKSLVDYDMWGQDPVRAGWNTALNIGTFFIPTAGAVAGSVKTGLKSASVAMEAGRAADILAGAAKVAGKVETIITAPSRFANDIISKIGRRFDDLNLGDLAIREPVNHSPVHTPDTPPGHINLPDHHSDAQTTHVNNDAAGPLRTGDEAQGTAPNTDATPGLSTGDALEERVQALLPGVRTNGFHDIGDPDRARIQIETLEGLVSKYPVEGFLDQVSFSDPLVMSPRSAAWVRSSRTHSELSYSRADTLDQMQMDKAISTGWYHAALGTNPAAYTSTHEFGHVLQNMFGNEAINTKVREILSQAIDKPNLSSDAQIREIAHEAGLISGYAGSKMGSMQEVVAESFAAVEMSPQLATDVEKAIHSLLTGGII